MAQFSSDADRKKWESLQNSAGSSLEAIVHGRASNSDFQRVATVLNGLNGLAANVFSQAVSAAEVQAKKFEASYENVLATRDNETLTAFELALNDQLSKLAPDIVGSLKEIIEMSALESNDDLTRSMGGRFSDIESLLPPRDLPTVNDLLTANDLLADQINQANKLLADAEYQEEDAKWEKRESSLVEKIADAFRDTLRDLAETINRERAARAGPSPAAGGHHVPRLTGQARYDAIKRVDVKDIGLPPLLQHANQMITDPEEELRKLNELTGTEQGAPESDENGLTTTSPSTLPKGRESPTISLSQKAENAITTAAQDQTTLYSKLLDFLSGGPAEQGGKGHGQEQGHDEEEEKADTWWRSFRNWMGDPAKKYKEFKKDNAGWLKALGSALALMILDPQLFKSFGEMVEKYLTWDNLKSAVSTAWDWVYKQGASVVDWVMSKLGLDKAIDKQEADASRKDGPDSGAKQTQSTIDRLKDPAVQAAIKAHNDEYAKTHPADKNPNATMPDLRSDAEKKESGSWQSSVNNFLGKTIGYRFDKGSDATVNKSMGTKGEDGGYTFTTGDSSASSSSSVGPSSSTNSVDASSVSAASNRSSLTSNTTNNQSTQSVPGTPVKMTPGTTTTAPGSATSVAPAGGSDGRTIKGSPQVGIGSFGFNASIDDSLTMMNTSYFTG